MQPVASVEVSPSAETIGLGGTLQLMAEGFDATGHAVAEAEFAWESSDAAIATVDASGLVTGVAEGVATITASSGSASGAATITVVNVTGPVVSVEVSPSAEDDWAGWYAAADGGGVQREWECGSGCGVLVGVQ